MTIDIRSMGYVRVASTDLDQWKLFAGKVLGLAEGRGPNPDNQYCRIDQVSARLVVFPCDVDQLVGHRLGGRRPPGAPGGARAPREGRRGLRGGHRARSSTSAGCRSWSGSPTRGTTSSSCSTASPTSRGPSSRRTPRRSSPATRGWATSCCRWPTTWRRCAFYTDVLGFRLRDSMSMPGEFVGKEPGSKVWLRFLGVNPRHHSLAFLPMPNPVQVRPHHARGRRARPRRPRAGAGAQAQGAAVGDARPPHERRDDLVLREVARRLRRRVRHRRPAGRRRAAGWPASRPPSRTGVTTSASAASD